MIPASRLAWTRLDEYDGPRPSPAERVISVTNLVSAPRIARLIALHRSELPSNAPRYDGGRLVTPDTWAVYGTALHSTLERAARAADPAPLLVEHRLETEVSVEGVLWKVSGKLDVFEADLTLWDWKSTSAYTVSEGRTGKGEWACQLNTLAWLLARNGHPKPRKLAVWGFWKDWSQKMADRDASYPQDDEGPVDVPLWTDDEQHAYVLDRLRLHEAARHSLPECSPEERWAKDAGFAVLKSAKSVRAERVLPTRQDAERYRDELLGGKGLIEERPGTSTRCLRYCPAKSVCDFAKSLLDSRCQ
jgi:hypothetical protein